MQEGKQQQQSNNGDDHNVSFLHLFLLLIDFFSIKLPPQKSVSCRYLTCSMKSGFISSASFFKYIDLLIYIIVLILNYNTASVDDLLIGYEMYHKRTVDSVQWTSPEAVNKVNP